MPKREIDMSAAPYEDVLRDLSPGMKILLLAGYSVWMAGTNGFVVVLND